MSKKKIFTSDEIFNVCKAFAIAEQMKKDI